MLYDGDGAPYEKNKYPDVFKVEYHCGNCGSRFTEAYPEGVSIDKINGIVYKNGYGDYKVWGKIACNVCKLNSDIAILYRYPIKRGFTTWLKGE